MNAVTNSGRKLLLGTATIALVAGLDFGTPPTSGGGGVTPPVSTAYEPDDSATNLTGANAIISAWLADWNGTVPSGKDAGDIRVVEVTDPVGGNLTISGINASAVPGVIIRGSGPYGYNASYPYNPTSGAHINGTLTVSGCNNIEVALFTCKKLVMSGGNVAVKVRRNGIHSQWSATRSVPSASFGVDIDGSNSCVVAKNLVGGFNTGSISHGPNVNNVTIEDNYVEQFADDAYRSNQGASSVSGIVIRNNWVGRDNLSGGGAHSDYWQSHDGTTTGTVFRGNTLIEATSLNAVWMQGGYFPSTTNSSPNALVEQNILIHSGQNSIQPQSSNSTVRYNTCLYPEVGAHGSTQPSSRKVPRIEGTWATHEYNFACRYSSGAADTSGTGGKVFTIGNVDASAIVADTSEYPTYFEGFPGEASGIAAIEPKAGSPAHWDYSGQKIGAYERSREIWIEGLHPGNDGWPTAGRFHAEYDPANTLDSAYTGIFDSNGENAGPAPTSLTIAEAATPVFDTDRFGAQLASIRVNIGHDVPNVVVQYRIFDHATPATTVVDWTDAALGSGSTTAITMSVPENVEAVRAEVRAKYDTGVTATQSNRWFAGNNVMTLCQSLGVRPYTLNFPSGVSFSPPTERLWVNLNDVNGTASNGPIPVTGSSVIGLRRMAAVFAKYNAPRMIIGDGGHVGTGRDQLLDDSKSGRDWTDSFQSAVDAVRALGTDFCAILEHWFTNEAAVQLELERHVAPGYLRQVLGGLGDTDNGSGLQPYTTGTINTGNNGYSPDNFIWDMTGGGQGLFDADRTKWVPWWGASFFNRTNPVTDGGVAPNDAQKSKIQAAMRDMATGIAMGQVSLASVSGWTGQTGFGGHLAMPDGTHVAQTDIDGESLVAVYMAHALLRVIGVLPRAEPEIVSWTFAGDRSYVDVDISLPHGGNLSTAYIQHGAGAYAGTLEATEWVTPSVLPETTVPELHHVQGFAIVRSGSQSYRNFTASIVDTGSGTGAARKGTVRITPTSVFASGTDGFSFGYVDGFHLLNNSDKSACRPHIHAPLETRTHASGCGYGYPAIRYPNTSAIGLAP